jgi:phosphoribosylanthranilate isomerase
MKIKICGITNAADCCAAVAVGADYIGFIFYPLSPRYVTAEKASGIIRRVNREIPRPYSKVGVFVNESLRVITDIYQRVGLDIVQLHGDESPGYCRQLALPYWKALRIKDLRTLEGLGRYDGEAVLLDTFVEGMYGGTGLAFSPDLAEEAIKIAEAGGVRVIISGGISIENIEILCRLPRPPYAVDVNSSLEESPGKKGREKIEGFFETFNRVMSNKA